MLISVIFYFIKFILLKINFIKRLMSKDVFKLYNYFYSSASWRVRIALNLK